MPQSSSSRCGRVYLVGAGPGDPSLLTLRGAECLGRADVVIYDYLANPVVLLHAPPQAERVCLGHHGQGRIVTQEGINALMVAAAREGKTVVRLKGGDPDVFGRSGDEIAALAEAGIPWETVPGVTAAFAAASYAGVPMTHADFASAVALVTGHERGCKNAPPLDYAALAHFPGTLVFYMGVTTAEQWSRALIGGGKPPDTPVAIVRRVSWGDQETIRCTLGTVCEEISRRHLRPPAVIVIGEVVSLAREATWFTARPLFGRRVLVTRPRHQAHAMVARFSELGAEVLIQPAIEVLPPDDWRPVDAAIADLDRYDWLVFSSANGVCFLLDRLDDLRRLGGVKLAAIGPGTAEELAHYRLRADLVPANYRAESLAAALAKDAAGRRFLLARASRGREVLAEQLAAAGGQVTQVVVYRSVDVQEADPGITETLSAGRIDWITVSSSAIARSLARLFGENLRRARLASISPITSEVLRASGYPPAAEAMQYTMAGLIDAIARCECES